MSNKAFISSAVLHGVILALMAMDFSFARFDNPPPPPAILMVDLSKVKISDKTNLPPKATVKPKKIVPKPATKPAQPTPTKTVKAQVQPPPPKPAPIPPAKNAAPVIEPPKKEEKAQKKENVAPAKSEPKAEQKPSAEDRLKNLLASVDKVKRAAPTPQTSAEPKEMQINEGIEGGTEGSLTQMLTISERDLIAGQLSKCWSLDAGKKDIDNIIIEIRAQINKDGTVREVKVLNTALDPVHQSVAESAKRAVLICNAKEDESPFKILAQKYADHYGDWKTMHLRFNPLTGGVM